MSPHKQKDPILSQDLNRKRRSFHVPWIIILFQLFPIRIYHFNSNHIHNVRYGGTPNESYRSSKCKRNVIFPLDGSDVLLSGKFVLFKKMFMFARSINSKSLKSCGATFRIIWMGILSALKSLQLGKIRGITRLNWN